MKRILTGLFILISCIVSGQTNLQKELYEFKNKVHLYYVDARAEQVFVYNMGGYYDKAGSGYAITWTDTLSKQGNAYEGKLSRVVIENDNISLLLKNKKAKKLSIHVVHDLAGAYEDLNNAYYLRHYFALSRELNEKYKLNHHSFREAYSRWESLQNKGMEYLQFKNFADKQLQRIRDSVSHEQDQYVAISNYILNNISSLTYEEIKDSLQKLPVDYMPKSAYHGTVIAAIAKHKPEYFFKLAEDFPSWRTLMYFAVDRDKEAMDALKSVQGYAEMKKAVFRRRM